MYFEQINIGKVAKVKSGYSFKSKDWQESGVPVVKIANVKDGSLDMQGCSFVSEEIAQEARKFRLRRGDILVSMTGYIGELALVRTDEHILLNQRVGRFDFLTEDVDRNFFFYALKLPSIKTEMQSHAYGAAQPNISSTLIENLMIPFPELPIQNRIGGILYSFDDLIENNSKRIKILEEMARLIYREWFVYYRFPHHETVKMVDCDLEMRKMPSGWKICPIDDLIEIQSGYPFKSGTFAEGGKWKLVTIKNVQDGYFVSECKDKLDELPSNMKDHCHLKDLDILMSLTGNIGRVCLVYGEDYVLNQRVAKLHPREERFRAFTYCKFRDSDFQKKLELLANGVAQQNLSPVETKRIEILKPTDELMDSFDKIASPMIHLISLLHKRNNYLRDTRDLLLPKLISGQLAVA